MFLVDLEILEILGDQVDLGVLGAQVDLEDL